MRIYLLLLIGILCFSLKVDAQSVINPDGSGVIYVKKGSVGTGSSWTNAVGELADALKFAHMNNADPANEQVEQIWVAKGTYMPMYSPEDGLNFGTNQGRDNSFLLVKDVQLYGGFSGTETELSQRNLNITANKSVLSGDFLANDVIVGSGATLDISNNSENTLHVVLSVGEVGTAELNGFTVSGGSANGSYNSHIKINSYTIDKDCGGGMLNCRSFPIVRNNIFIHNNGTNGGGMHNNSGSSPDVINCTFTLNTATNAGGMYNHGSRTRVTTSTFSSNNAANGGGMYNQSTLLYILNSTFSLNSSAKGGGMYNHNGSPFITNSTISHNLASDGNEIYNTNFSSPIISNSIVWNSNNSSYSNIYNCNGCNPEYAYSLIVGSRGSANWFNSIGINNGNNIATDPMFVSAADFSLQAGSPAINAGSNLLYTSAYFAGDINTVKDIAGKHRLSGTSIDMGAYEMPFGITPTPDAAGIIYVKQNGAGDLSGNSWLNAIPELADALIFAKINNADPSNAQVKQIWVAKGIYKPLYSAQSNQNFGTDQGRQNTFLLVKDTKVYGGFDPDNGKTDLSTRNTKEAVTTLSGDFNDDDTVNGLGASLSLTNMTENALHVVVSVGNVGNAELNGFTIKGGNADNAQSFSIQSHLAHGHKGAGIYTIKSSPIISNCILNLNYADLGGGMYNQESSPKVINCLFSFNKGINGGAMYNETSDTDIINSTISLNSANIGYALYNVASLPTLYNSIVFNEVGGTVIGIHDNTNNYYTNSRYSLIEGDKGGNPGNLDASNITINNIFRNPAIHDFTLINGGRASNRGNNGYYQAYSGNINTDNDLAGNPRLIGGVIDMGAYESPYEPVVVTSVTTNTTDGSYGIGSVIYITVAFSQTVFLNGAGGKPTLLMETGTIDRAAVFATGLSTKKLLFEYTVQEGDLSADLDYVSSSAIVLNGADIVDFAYRNAILTLPAPGTAGSIGAAKDIVINGSTPIVTSIVRKKPTIETTNASVVEFTVNFSEAVKDVRGTDFVLSTGTISSASIMLVTGSGSGSGTEYTVSVATGTGEGTVAINLVANGSGITNEVGNPIKTDFGPSEVYTIDKTPPTLTNVTMVSNNPSPKLAKAGDIVTVSFTASETINVTNILMGGVRISGAVTNDNINWTFTASMTGAFPEGPLSISIDFKDFAGNEGSTVISTTDALPVVVDRTLPIAPNFLGVTSGGQQNTLTWFLNADYAKYELIGGIPGVLGNTVLTTITAANAANPMTFTQAGLTNFTTYYYALRVYDAAGNVNTSYTVSGTPLNSQTITFDQPVAAEYGSSFIINATSSSGLPVTLTSNEPAIATISGNTVTIVGVNHFQSVSIFATQAGNANYSNAPSVTRLLQIKPRPVTITAHDTSKEYGSPEPGFTASISPSLVFQDQIIGGSLSRAPGEDAGEYDIDPSNIQLNPYKYAVTYVPANFTIKKKIVTINPVANTKNYNQNDPRLNFIIDVDDVPVTGALTRTSGEDTGSYAYSISGMTVGPNYHLALSPTPKFIITPLTISVTATAGSKQYGDTEPLLAYTHSPALKSGDSFSGTLTRVSGETPGIYPVSQGTLTLSTNYLLNYNPGPVNFTVLKKDININPIAGQGKVYGELDGPIAYTVNPILLDGDTFTGSLARTSGENTGNYLISNQSLKISNPLTASNYSLLVNSANETYAVEKKDITVTATAASKPFGAAEPVSFDYTADPLLAGNSFAGRLERVAGEASGDYAIKQGSLNIPSENYNINFVGAKFSVEKQQITITPKPTLAKVYTEDDPTFEYDVSPIIPGVNITGALARTAGEDVGSYDFNLGTLSVGTTYELVLNSTPKFSIARKTITVVPDAVQKMYGDPVVAPTYSYSPELASGDTFIGNITTPMITSAFPSFGGYTFDKGTLALSNNYDLVFASGTLRYSVTAKPIKVVPVANQGKVYEEDDQTINYSALPVLFNSDQFIGSLSRVAGSDVGTYKINQGTLSAGANYTLTVQDEDYTIIPRLITLTPVSASKTYGDADPTFTYSGSGTLNSPDVFTGALARTPGTDVGSYLLNIGTLKVNDNYTLSLTEAYLDITAAPLTITAEASEKFTGTANPVFTAQYSGFINDEDTSVFTSPVVFNTPATISSPIGIYDIIPSGAAAHNYEINFVKGVLTVKPGAPTDILFAGTTLYENQVSGTLAGHLSSNSGDPQASFTYSLVSGTGDTDNGLFRINGDQLITNIILDYEHKKVYSVNVRSTTQHGFSLDKVFTISLNDINESPTLDAIASKAICYISNLQSIDLTGISAGPDAEQKNSITVTGSNPDLLQSLTVSAVSGGKAKISYRIKNGASGISTITVTVKDDGGVANGGVDTYTQTFVITVNALPVLSINSDKRKQIKLGETAMLTVSGAETYVWSADNSVITGGKSATLIVRPKQTTTYTVTGTNANGCSESQTFTLTVIDDLSMVKASNILTPNGDGYNDKWIIDNIDFYPNNEVKVFDKTGRIVFTKKGYDNSWDGTFNGTPLTEGTYYYIIDFGVDKRVLKGFITVVRD